jgi:hypothetical protein
MGLRLGRHFRLQEVGLRPPDEQFETAAITAAELWIGAGTGNGKGECRRKLATFKARYFAQIKGPKRDRTEVVWVAIHRIVYRVLRRRHPQRDTQVVAGTWTILLLSLPNDTQLHFFTSDVENVRMFPLDCNFR